MANKFTKAAQSKPKRPLRYPPLPDSKRSRSRGPKTTTSVPTAPLAKAPLRSRTLPSYTADEPIIAARLFQAYFQLGPTRTLDTLFPLTFDIEGCTSLTFTQLKSIATRYKWDEQVIKWDAELDRRLCARVTSETADAIGLARNFLAEELQKLSRFVLQNPDTPFISNMDDFNKAVKLLFELADRLPDGSKRTRTTETLALVPGISSETQAIANSVAQTLTKLADGRPVRELILELDRAARAESALETPTEPLSELDPE